MTEAVEGITRFAFDLLHAERIEIRMDARNRRSAAVAERAGYVLEARLKHQMRGLDGSLRDTLVLRETAWRTSLDPALNAGRQEAQKPLGFRVSVVKIFIFCNLQNQELM